MIVFPAYSYSTGGPEIFINFTNPIARDPKPEERSSRKDVIGGTGVRQVNWQFNERIITLEHEFVPESEIDLVATMMRDWVLRGGSFKFYEDQTVTGIYQILQLLDKNFEPTRMSKKVDIWRFELTCRVEI